MSDTELDHAGQAPAPALPSRSRLADRVVLSVVLACSLALVLVSIKLAPTSLLAPAQPIGAPTQQTVAIVTFNRKAFSAPPTWQDLGTYLGLEAKLVAATRDVNALSDGECPPEIVPSLSRVKIALVPNPGPPCRRRDGSAGPAKHGPAPLSSEPER